MRKEEFLEGLRLALNGRVSDSLINENLNYYSEYIDAGIREGRSEADATEELGDPRLLAKSIIEANKHAGEGAAYEEVGQEQMNRSTGGTGPMSGAGRMTHMPGWLILVIVLLVIFCIFGLFFSILSWMAPILLPVLLIIFIVRIVRSLVR